ncbi:MAG: HAD-IIIA family hydrolase [Chitinophagaceae bacterium]|nr:HAD-IIIA family hydrolase [Chitinophagaceae bacterium]
MMNNELNYNKEWTLFLDRDGVINEEIQGTYVTKWEEFIFYKHSLKSIAALSSIFGRVVIVTNQRGVGRGIMQLADLIDIHQKMETEIVKNGGRIDKIYACTAINNDDGNRKPNIGMGLQAKEDFEEIDFKKSIMVGNNLSDMRFGKKLLMKTIFLSTTNMPVEMPHDIIDEQYSSLKDWANSLNFRSEPALN